MSMRERRPRWVYGSGTEPDPRFTLANERTLLAWIRTSLALAAAGLAVLFTEVLLGDWTPLVSAAAFTLSLVVVVGAVSRWARMERSLRLGEGLPAPWLALTLVGALVLGIVSGAVAVLVSGP
jgi:putative membrane protein